MLENLILNKNKELERTKQTLSDLVGKDSAHMIEQLQLKLEARIDMNKNNTKNWSEKEYRLRNIIEEKIHEIDKLNDQLKFKDLR